jgi:transcriptional regulator with XRE-family HTH domain
VRPPEAADGDGGRRAGTLPGAGLDDNEATAAARAELGRQLADFRLKAGLSQRELAPLIGYSRGALSDAERGRGRISRDFWKCADRALAAGGELLAGFDRIGAMRTAQRSRAARQQQAEREERLERRRQGRQVTGGAVPAGAGGIAGRIAVQECPNCHQPVEVILLAAAGAADPRRAPGLA